METEADEADIKAAETEAEEKRKKLLVRHSIKSNCIRYICTLEIRHDGWN